MATNKNNTSKIITKKDSKSKQNIVELLNETNTNIINTNDTTSANTKKKTGAISKPIKYKVERQEVLDKLLIILEITETNMMFNLTDLEKNDKKQQEIINLADDIKKYFNYGSWTYFSRENIKTPYLALLKALLKEMGYKLTYLRELDTKTKRVDLRIIKLTKLQNN